MNINDIWKQRFLEYIKEVSRYMRYMFNDHLMIVLLIAISAGAVYYNQWLSQLPDTFPFQWVMAIILGVTVTSSAIRSFLKEPDLVFLLPVEHRMNTYFKNGLIYSFIMQGFILLLTYFALVPMYIQFSGNLFYKITLVFFIMLVLKGWNMFLTWRMLHLLDRNSTVFDYVIRLFYNIVFLALLLSSASFIYLFILLIIAVLWALAFFVMSKGKSVKWELLLKAEIKQMNRFYQLANLFVDVPHLRNEVKPRRWLDWVSSSIPLHKERLFDFLYLKTFIRSGEYLGLYVRLIVIAGIIIIGVHLPYAGLIIVPFFIYLSGLQLLAMFKQHDYKLWLDLYPVSITERRLAFLGLIFKLMLGKGVVLSTLLFWTEGVLIAILCVVISSLFSYLFVHYYLKNKLLKITSI
jgi:ABC-2 type transport system permease protein